MKYCISEFAALIGVTVDTKECSLETIIKKIKESQLNLEEEIRKNTILLNK